MKVVYRGPRSAGFDGRKDVFQFADYPVKHDISRDTQQSFSIAVGKTSDVKGLFDFVKSNEGKSRETR